MYSLDYDTISKVNGELINEVLAKKSDTGKLIHGDMWKTPWAPDKAWDGDDHGLWDQFTINLPRTDKKIRVRWLAPIQVYHRGAWVDCNKIYTGDGINAGGDICYKSFSVLMAQLRALRNIYPAMINVYTNLELLRGLCNIAVPTWQEGTANPVNYRCGWSLLCTDRVGMHIVLDCGCRVDNFPLAQIGAVVISRLAPPRLYIDVPTGCEAPLWRALQSWVDLFAIYQEDVCRCSKEKPIKVIDPTV